jgi:hypothetical protein
MNLSEPIRSDAEFAKVMKPRRRSLYDPTIDTKAAAVFRIAASDLWKDPSPAKLLAMRV